MERSLKTTTNKDTCIRALFATKKAADSEKDLNNFNLADTPDQGSLDYDSDQMNESEREEYDDLDESLRKSTKWTDGTDKKLRSLVEEHGTKNWKFIASQLKNKTPVQCLHRWNKILKPGLVKGPWTIEEDRKLLEWVKINGPMKWTSCSDFISGRSGKQCRERWFNTLNPNVKKGGWTPEEDFLIFKFFSEFGSKWSLIASKFPGRTENSVKNRFYSTLRRISLDKKKILFNEKKNNNTNINNNSNNFNCNIGNNTELNGDVNSGNSNNFNSINNINNNNNGNNNIESNGSGLNNNNNNNSSDNNLNFNNNDNLTVNYPSSNLEELMKYLPQAFAEKTRIYLEFKKNEGKLAENLNVNIESFQDLEKLDLNSLIKNSNLNSNSDNINNNNNLCESPSNDMKIRNKKAPSAKKQMIASANCLENLRSLSTYETKKASGYCNKNPNFAVVSNFMQNAELLNTYTTTNDNDQNKSNEDQIHLIENKIATSGLLKKKRIRGENKEAVPLASQINNTFNFNFNINNNAANLEDNLLQPAIKNRKSKKKKNLNRNYVNSNCDKNNSVKSNEQSNLKKKKFETKKFAKIEELEQMIQNFTENSSKSVSCEGSEEDAKKPRKISSSKAKGAKGDKNTKSKFKTKKRFIVENVENKSKASNHLSSQGNNLGSSASSVEKENSATENSTETKEFLFKIPEICSNEEVTKLSLNLMQRTNYNFNSQSKCNLNSNNNLNNEGKNNNNNNNNNSNALNNNVETYLYLENQKPQRSGNSKKSEKEEIFKFDALNNLYDQLNNLENILLNTKKQLFNLDKFFYKEITSESNCLSKFSHENLNSNSIPAPNKIENISNNIIKLNEGINVIKSLEGAGLGQQANLTSVIDIQNFKNKNLNFTSREAAPDTITFSEGKEFKKSETSNKTSNQESMLTLPHIDKNSLFFHDDLPYLNINETVNLKIGGVLNNQNSNPTNNININNLFNSNLLFNNFEGQIQEEQEYPFMDNMFQI